MMMTEAATAMKPRTAVERKSDRELVLTRRFNASAQQLFDAWTKPELLKQWWAPKTAGITLLSCEVDARTGGTYRFVFQHVPEPVAFFGRYLEVSPHSRLVWTNEDGGDAGQISTMTLEARGATTRMVLHELFPSREALDAGVGAYDGMPESFDQLDEVLAG